MLVKDKADRERTLAIDEEPEVVVGAVLLELLHGDLLGLDFRHDCEGVGVDIVVLGFVVVVVGCRFLDVDGKALIAIWKSRLWLPRGGNERRLFLFRETHTRTKHTQQAFRSSLRENHSKIGVLGVDCESAVLLAQ